MRYYVYVDAHRIDRHERGTMSDAPRTIVTPGALAEELDIDPKRVRAYLRKAFTREATAKNTSWDLTPETADLVREYFAAKAS